MITTSKLLKTRKCFFCRQKLMFDNYEYTNSDKGWVHKECAEKNHMFLVGDNYFERPPLPHCNCAIVSDIHFGDATEEEINAMSQIYNSVVLTGE